MKHLINLFLLLVPFVAVTAQKTIDEGYIKLEITEVTSEDKNMASQLKMMEGSITEVYFTDGKYRTSSNMMGGMAIMENHINVESRKVDMLFSMMGKKMWIDTNLDEAKQSKMGVQNVEDYKVEYDKSQTKEILGYSTYKVIITSDKQGMSAEGWITEQIKTDANIIQGMEDLKLAGFPLELTISVSAMKSKMTMAATEIKDTVDASSFVLKTDGYEKMTMKEFMDSMGGMMGMF